MARVSAIFCSYNRYDLLREAVASLKGIGDCTGDVEIIVVDNTPAGEREDLSDIKGATTTVCDETGLSAARNTGIRMAQGEFIAFLDDDVYVQEGWAGAILDTFDSHPDCMICGGLTEPFYDGINLPEWYSKDLAGYLSCIDWGARVRPLTRGEWLVGANIAFRREVFDTHGLFATGLGRKGNQGLLSNEELELMRRVGLDHVFYVPAMHVMHRIPEKRLQLDWFRARAFWQGISDILSGDIYLDRAEMQKKLTEAAVATPPKYRNLRIFDYPPETPEDFRMQLQAIYASALKLGTA